MVRRPSAVDQGGTGGFRRGKVGKDGTTFYPGNVVFVGGDASTGTRRPTPLSFFEKVQVRSSPLRKLAEVKVSGLPWRILIANQLPSKRASYWQRSMCAITGIGFLAGAKRLKARPTGTCAVLGTKAGQVPVRSSFRSASRDAKAGSRGLRKVGRARSGFGPERDSGTRAL